MKSFFFIFILIFQVKAEDLEFSGRFYSDYFQKMEGNGDILTLLNEMWLTSDYKNGPYGRGHVTLINQFSERATDSQSSSNQIHLREAYWFIGKENWSLKYGKIIHRWGKSEIYNPLDLWIGQDLSYIVMDNERQFRAAPTLFVFNWTKNHHTKRCTSYKIYSRRGKKIKKWKEYKIDTSLSPFNFQLVGSIDSPINNLALSNIERDGYTFNFQESNPNTKTPEFGTRLYYMGDSFSIGILAFKGFHHQPYFQVESISGKTITLSDKIIKKTTFGLDYEHAFSNSIFRFDLAYNLSESKDYDISQVNTHIDAVMTFEFKIGQNWRFLFFPNFKYFPKYDKQKIIESQSDPINYATQETNRIHFNETEAQITRVASALRYENEESDFKFQLISLYNVTMKDYMINSEFRLCGSYSWICVLKRPQRDIF